ncbi:MAG: flagellar biosynthesis regulator FlaF [Henriciella sp.]|nr:flagellar biosynthesis regulator FlaF [Henriciella sp.]
MQKLALKAYGEVGHRTASDKQIEYALFQQITHSLEDAALAGSASPEAWAEAINRNLQMWTIISVDLLHPENNLAEATKKSLLYLAEFVRQSSMQILAGKGDIAELIEVNAVIMVGLAGTAQPAINAEVV